MFKRLFSWVPAIFMALALTVTTAQAQTGLHPIHFGWNPGTPDKISLSVDFQGKSLQRGVVGVPSKAKVTQIKAIGIAIYSYPDQKVPAYFEEAKIKFDKFGRSGVVTFTGRGKDAFKKKFKNNFGPGFRGKITLYVPGKKKYFFNTWEAQAFLNGVLMSMSDGQNFDLFLAPPAPQPTPTPVPTPFPTPIPTPVPTPVQTGATIDVTKVSPTTLHVVISIPQPSLVFTGAGDNITNILLKRFNLVGGEPWEQLFFDPSANLFGPIIRRTEFDINELRFDFAKNRLSDIRFNILTSKDPNNPLDIFWADVNKVSARYNGAPIPIVPDAFGQMAWQLTP